MTALDQAQAAYAPASAPIRTPRSAEFEVFARVTRRLQSAARATPADFPSLAAALHDNRRLWTALAADVSDAGNGLPDALRARLFYLHDFTRQHSEKVLTGSATADVLVEINTAVMKGLRGDAGDAS